MSERCYYKVEDTNCNFKEVEMKHTDVEKPLMRI